MNSLEQADQLVSLLYECFPMSAGKVMPHLFVQPSCYFIGESLQAEMQAKIMCGIRSNCELLCRLHLQSWAYLLLEGGILQP